MTPVPHATSATDRTGPRNARADDADFAPTAGEGPTRSESEGHPDVHAPGEDPRAARVREMFGSIAHRYDLLNRTLSLGVDAAWRREAVHEAVRDAPHDVLDVATGTADLAIGLKRAAPQARVIGVDFAEPMLAIGRTKIERAGLHIALEQGDGMALHYPADRFDVVTIAYGLRNFTNVEAGLREFHRVLRPGGRLVVLEFPPPGRGPLGRLFRLYFLHVLPRIGGLVSGDADAYAYLPRSVLAFPEPGELALRMQAAGFGAVRFKLQTYGISALHVATKPHASTSAGAATVEPLQEYRRAP